MSNEEDFESNLKSPNQIDAVMKIFPFVGKSRNRKGFYIGNYKIQINSDDLPFSNYDQVDHFIYNIYNYAKTRKNPQDFFVYHPENMTFIPGKINQVGGKRKKTRRKYKKNNKTKKTTI
jgi:hypothetical protein